MAIDREARAHKEALVMCRRIRAHPYQLATSRRTLYGGTTAEFSDREQRVKSHAIHLLCRAGVLALFTPSILYEWEEKSYGVSADHLKAFLEAG